MRRFTLIIFTLLLLMTSCGKSAEERFAYQRVDSLNTASYQWRYISLDSAEAFAKNALRLAQSLHYVDGKHEADCNLGFVNLMHMHYNQAIEQLQHVRQTSRNELLKLLADVQLMRVCQRRSLNKDFYNYMESAQQHMKRLNRQSLTPHQQRIWNFCRSDYHLTLCTYYYYLRQEDEANEQFEQLANHPEFFQTDTAQLALYNFLLGNQRRVGEGLEGNDVDGLMRSLFLSITHHYHYISSKSITSIAEDILRKQHPRASQLVVLREILQTPDTIRNDYLSLWLCQKSIEKLKSYGSPFDVSETHLALASCYRTLAQPQQALAETLHALDEINRHHLQVTHQRDTLLLHPFETQPESICRELQWIHDSQAQAVPEWMADVREFLCMAYSDLGMKYESDYNRNIYLDILDATRQDRRMEQRMDEIKREETTLQHTMMLSIILLITLLLALIWSILHIRRNYEQKSIKEKTQVEHEMAVWLAHSDADFATLEKNRKEAEEERTAKELQLEAQKRQYIDKTTSLSIVHAISPFLDRALNETRHLSDPTDPTPRLQYINELTDRISLLNDILTRWIRVRQGAVNLRIENFPLQPLLNILSKSTNLFAQHGIQLQIEPSSAIIKADKALTLFMMNTLLDNARKFTPQGGRVILSSQQTQHYVEIAVTDTGCGLSQTDVTTLNEQRIYDSSRIGTDNNATDTKSLKGYGFGLMNCKGIIDKYRKTNPRIFAECKFGVESQTGKGSRFYFRLPLGILRILLCFLTLSPLSQLATPLSAQSFRTITDSVSVNPQTLPHDVRLDLATAYADSVYFANVARQHEQALCFADTAFQYLNKYYLTTTGDNHSRMYLCHPDSMCEIRWWQQQVPTDFHLILDLRNEVAIAALALREWNTYYYNNEIYTRLYKLMAQDTRLSDYVTSLRHTAQERHTAFIFIIALLILCLLTFAYYYYRHHILTTFTLRQILELSRHIFEQADDTHLANLLCEGINDIRHTEGVALLREDGIIQYSHLCPQRAELEANMRQYLHSQSTNNPSSPLAPSSSPTSLHTALPSKTYLHLYPLTTQNGQTIGIMALVMHDEYLRKDEDQYFQLIATYTATNIYYSTVRMKRLRTDIILTTDEQKRVSLETNAVHVQNQVLDNTLSTIKHETMYYPSRIQQLVHQLLQTALPPTTEQLHTLSELLIYYKEIFTLLTTCADRQVQHTLLRHTAIPLTEFAAYLHTSFTRQSSRQTTTTPHHLTIAPLPSATLLADRTMLHYLADNLISYFLTRPCGQNLHIDFVVSGKLLKFACSLDTYSLTPTQLHDLFNPESLHYDEQTDTLQGSQLLLIRQIIREHDEHVHRGLRIYAKPLQTDGTGLTICCTLPIRPNQSPLST